MKPKINDVHSATQMAVLRQTETNYATTIRLYHM